ncbi:flagellar biosynthesis protein FliO [Rhodoferax koreense]|uniref:Flagellar biosynthesis protein FliO n=1 Tax=Rhodoferax koreensis TaxID=1842727 RepID=A0A1P8JSB9_9BURK|nr:flagellar biosynthetic protein FliO [Rhodoferax koreense]APW36652.1 flagellar biosynthesis protein FliO [Rhodoferax koreense]
MLSQTLLMVVAFVALLAMVPWAIKWIQRRAAGAHNLAGANSRVISAVAVGPQQRVVTVEVGPEGARTWLVLGVTAQNINCLFTQPVEAAHGGAMPAPSRVLPEAFVVEGAPRG